MKKNMAEKYQQGKTKQQGEVFKGLAVRVFPDGSCLDFEDFESPSEEPIAHPNAWALLEGTISAEENGAEMNRLQVYLEDNNVAYNEVTDSDSEAIFSI